MRVLGFTVPVTWLQLSVLGVGLVSVLSLFYMISAADGRLVAALEVQDARLEVLSRRAERMRDFSRYLRRASLTNQSEPDIPFAGYLGAASQVEPGAKLRLGGRPGYVMEIISARKVRQTVTLADAPEAIELMLIAGRLVAAPDAALVHLLVAVSPEKGSIDKPAAAIEHQTL